ncbi:MAG: FHA domain-containing serine/threonine-protein kinase [Oligosphaeraceae bacterium]
MGTCLNPGDRVSRYRIEELLNDGAYAVAYRATDTTDAGRPAVFLKQYKSPSVRSGWYRGYIAYEEEIRYRIETGRLTEKTCRFLDFFESRDAGQRGYYQVFEYMERGRDLAAQLEDPAFRWEQRWTFAKLMLSTLHQLHEAGIVHCDLKPENLYLVESPALSTGYRLKVIDFDHSVLDDREAPWKGYESYAGTPGYLSPEHLRGECPVKASDVFTASLILHELLCQEGHPYSQGDPDAYQQQVLGYAAPMPVLRQSTGKPEDDQEVAALLHRCLDPDPGRRPTMKELHQALLQAGKGTMRSLPPPSAPSPREGAPTMPEARPWPPTLSSEEKNVARPQDGPVPLRRRPISPADPSASPPPRMHDVVKMVDSPPLRESAPPPRRFSPVPMPPPEGGSVPEPPVAPASPNRIRRLPVEPEMPTPAVVPSEVVYAEEKVPQTPREEPRETGLLLTGPDGRSVPLHLSTPVGKRFMGRFGEDARYYSELQYTLYPEGGQWHVAPNPAAQNQTLLNGRPLVAPQTLRNGDVLCVGNYAKGIEKLPLVVSRAGGDSAGEPRP